MSIVSSLAKNADIIFRKADDITHQAVRNRKTGNYTVYVDDTKDIGKLTRISDRQEARRLLNTGKPTTTLGETKIWNNEHGNVIMKRYTKDGKEFVEYLGKNGKWTKRSTEQLLKPSFMDHIKFVVDDFTDFLSHWKNKLFNGGKHKVLEGDRAAKLTETGRKTEVTDPKKQQLLEDAFGKNKSYDDTIDGLQKDKNFELTSSTQSIKKTVGETEITGKVTTNHIKADQLKGTTLDGKNLILSKFDDNAIKALELDSNTHKAVIDALQNHKVTYKTIVDGDTTTAVLDNIGLVKAGDGISEEVAKKVNAQIFKNTKETLKQQGVHHVKVDNAKDLAELHAAGMELPVKGALGDGLENGTFAVQDEVIKNLNKINAKPTAEQLKKAEETVTTAKKDLPEGTDTSQSLTDANKALEALQNAEKEAIEAEKAVTEVLGKQGTLIHIQDVEKQVS